MNGLFKVSRNVLSAVIRLLYFFCSQIKCRKNSFPFLIKQKYQIGNKCSVIIANNRTFYPFLNFV